MFDFIHKPHDSFFRSIFWDALVTGTMLDTNLPTRPQRRYVWPTLERAPADFVDDLLREHRSDLLFTVQEAETGLPAYILLEHQSSPDPSMAFRMMKYRMAIWDRIRRDGSRARRLPAVEPVVFYEGPAPWPYPADSTSVFASDDRSPTATPPMDFVLLDQTLVTPSEVRGSPLSCMAQWAMMAAFRPHQAEELVELLAQGMASWRDELEEGGREPILRYLYVTLEDEMVQQLRQSFQDHGAIEAAEKMQGLGQKVWNRGHAEGKVETVEGFLKAGASWELVETATGLDEARFRKLRAQVAAQ